jgi:DNA-binding CsgD family transcriptional regulator
MKPRRLSDGAKAGIIRACHAGLASAALRSGLIKRLRSSVPFDAVCFPTADPATLMITGGMSEGLPPEASRAFARVEYTKDDYNKFSRLARSRNLVRTLSDATDGRFERSARWRDVFGPLGFNDDLRAALVADGSCWGYLALHRQASNGWFDDEEIRFVAELAPHIAEGLRKALLLETATVSQSGESPGLILLDDDLNVVSTTAPALYWLSELGKSGTGIGELPSSILAAASSLQALERESAGTTGVPRSRLRTESGRWLVVHASRLAGEEQNGRIAVILELAQPLEIAPLIAAAYDLSDRERQILQQVLIGLSTSDISAALFISANTVQDHLKSIFEKTGVRSRRELVAQIFTQQYLPRMMGHAKLGPNGWFADAVSPSTSR